MVRKAREAYEQALSLRPDDPILKSAVGDARIKEFDIVLAFLRFMAKTKSEIERD